MLSIFGQARYNKRGPVCFHTLRNPTHELDCHSAKESAMKVFAGGIATETNTFSPMPTGMADFKIVRPETIPPEGISPEIDHFQKRTLARGWDFVVGLEAGAQPAGNTTRTTYESLRDEWLERLNAALPVDIVLLSLHGAMVPAG